MSLALSRKLSLQVNNGLLVCVLLTLGRYADWYEQPLYNIASKHNTNVYTYKQSQATLRGDFQTLTLHLDHISDLKHTKQLSSRKRQMQLLSKREESSLSYTLEQRLKDRTNGWMERLLEWHFGGGGGVSSHAILSI